MANAKKPAAGASNKAKSTGTKSGAGTAAPSKASGAGSKASKTAASASKATAKASAAAKDATTTAKAVTPSALKKDVVASDKPMPTVAKEPREADVAQSAAQDKSAAKPEPVTEKPTPVAAQQPSNSGSVFWPLVLGGVVAGVIGYGVSELNLLNLRTQDNELASSVATLGEQVSGQRERLATLEAVEPVTPDAPDLSGINEQIATLSTQLADIEARLKSVEDQPLSDGGTLGDAAAYERALQELQASVQDQKAEIQELIGNARSVEEATADAARKAAIQSALTEITTAISAGQPFDGAVAALAENGVTEMPAGLADVAADGVSTLAKLQTGFADQARAALSAARNSDEVEPETGVAGFLRRQLGARSTVPREGSDPDAVLSRAEAAVRDGQLATALEEIDTLPADAQSAIQDWLDQARARSAAEAAVQDLSNSLTAN